MAIELMAVAYVDPNVESVNGATPQCTLRTKAEIGKPIARYLDKKLDELFKKANDPKNPIPPAKFREVERGEFNSRAVLKAMKNRDEQSFLVGAQQFADRMSLHADHRMTEGFFVALRRAAGKQKHVAILRVEPHGLGARTVTVGGRRMLRGVEDVLDLPGEFHKGAVYPDSRGNSDLIIIDEYHTTYFLDVMRANQYATRQRSTKCFVDIILRETAVDKEKLYRAVSSLGTASDPQDALAHIAGVLESADLSAVPGAVEAAEILPQTIDPTKVKSTLKAGGLTISGTVDEIDAIRKQMKAKGGGWQLKFSVEGTKAPLQKVTLGGS